MSNSGTAGLSALWWRLLSMLGSLKLTLVILAALGVGVIVAYQSETKTIWALVMPLTLCAVNLLAALASNPVFRRQIPLLVFHLALLAIILLVAVGRMTYLKGHLELVEGQEFDGVLTAQESGPWHLDRLSRVHFVNAGYTIDYAPGMRRGATQNRVLYRDGTGLQREAMIGDNVPLVLSGYRLYTSFNKGFAPTFMWYPAAAAPGTPPLFGAVHLPAYPLHEYRQAMEWVLPGTEIKAWTMLQFDDVVLDPDKASTFRLPEKHKLVMRIGGQRRELVPGESLILPEGRLEYAGLRTWMGYTVFSDWTITWLLSASLLAVASLGWHFWRKFTARPWNE